MDNVFTVNAAYVTAIAAILAPTITALIHSIKEFQIAKMNSTVSTRLELCEKFSDAYSKCQSSFCPSCPFQTCKSSIEKWCI